MPSPPSAEAIARLKALAGEGGWSQDPDRLAPKLVEWRDRWMGETPLLLLPRTLEEVSALITACAGMGVAVTPQGGNTGLVGGQIPVGEVLLSLERMRAIREVSPLDDVIVAEAGVTLAEVQQAAAAAGRYFPLSLASEGTATIGGTVSTNAGGTAVLRYGTMRDLVLGLEAVLPDGSIFRGLKRLRKDNTGYDLKQLLIGAEGTLGVVTAAALKLFPQLHDRAVSMVGLKSPEAALDLLVRAKVESGGALETFELMGRMGVGLAVKNIPGVREPLEGVHSWYVLIEIASAEPGHAMAATERLLGGALESGLIDDAAVAQNETQGKEFWHLRESQSAAQKPEGVGWKHDVATPISQTAAFIAEATAAVEAFAPGVRVMAFGHLGDGNIHFNVLQPAGADGAPYSAMRAEAAEIVHDIAAGYGGSISAEHGLGVMKTAEALRYKTPEEVAAMKALRAALDPKRILNPRVLF
jgi:FAD/FMN-containing dehydrogenase